MPTRQQLALVHVAKRELRLSDDVYRDILAEQGGVESAKELSAAGLERVLKRFRELGFRRRATRPRRAGRAVQAGDPPSPLQLAKVRHLWEDLGWREEKRRQGFARRVCGHPWPQTEAEASALIEALKSMVLRGYRDRTPRRPRTSGSPPSSSRGSGA